MLTATENELLSQVGPGTAAGETIRQYWLPVLLSYELLPDGAIASIVARGEGET